MQTIKPTLLLILDGCGLADPGPGNAISLARTPNLDRLMSNYPMTRLLASGEAVGLPQGQMGNSEVGHLNIGAGRVVYQDIVRIDRAIKDGSFFTNQTLLQLIDKVKEQNGRLHLLGLVSDGGVHSHQNHIYALLKLAKQQGLKKVYIQAFLDGRDTPPSSGRKYLLALEKKCQQIGCGQIASLCGRYYAMDRDNRWERVQKAYLALTRGQGRQAKSVPEAIETAYARKETDEFVQPTLITPEGLPEGLIQDGDGLFFFNFRADRARELVRALSDANFRDFERPSFPVLSGLATMTEYDQHFGLPVAFPPMVLNNILGEICSNLGMQQFRTAETEKYAHVTYFFNGGREDPFPGEERLLIPSPKEVATYDQKPEMSVHQVTENLLQKLDKGHFGLLVCNFANLDMVGHTGQIAATIKACEAVDFCLGQVADKILEHQGRMFVTADHGNADEMLDDSNAVQTAHSKNPVPFIWVEEGLGQVKLRKQGILGDIAPTILDLWSIAPPQEMDGHSLVDK